MREIDRDGVPIAPTLEDLLNPILEENLGTKVEMDRVKQNQESYDALMKMFGEEDGA